MWGGILLGYGRFSVSTFMALTTICICMSLCLRRGRDKGFELLWLVTPKFPNNRQYVYDLDNNTLL